MKLAIAAASLGLLTANGASAADLTLTLRTQGSGGTIAVAVYANAADFRASRNPIATRVVPAPGGATSVTIPDLAPGRYAVGAFHDADRNGELTLWPVGLPREAYGFSRNARGRFGPPAFEAAAFDLPPEGTRQAITLR
ncbi:DUF2141 domain-containing protein [Brevundimonas bacteroides]|uniref:DUF2141 domain-containing protein n=1 Tax=Brevundimonas bacteroides TaxID=74311 RepID=UPI000496143B|nr:DUF2141 domain-containing protein [Brevundimonas bacteroides]